MLVAVVAEADSNPLQLVALQIQVLAQVAQHQANNQLNQKRHSLNSLQMSNQLQVRFELILIPKNVAVKIPSCF